MSLRQITPCDYGHCPYEAENIGNCEYWCGANEPQDNPEMWEEDDIPEWDEILNEVAEEYKNLD